MTEAAVADHLASHFVNKTVDLKFMGKDLSLDLSQGLFASAGIDSGTRLLLKVLGEGYLRSFLREGSQVRVLDAGCGVGVLGICAAAALCETADVSVRCQDRDELARAITLRNAARNRIPESAIEVHAEPLLSGPADVRWDVILSNIPAKAGAPVLEDFAGRSAGLLAEGGIAATVIVLTLAGFFRECLVRSGAAILLEQKGSGYGVFVYARGNAPQAVPVVPGSGFLSRYPFYARANARCLVADILVELETVHGASGFDDAGDAVQAAARLALRLGGERVLPVAAAPVLIHEPAQGFFACWLREFLLQSIPGDLPEMILSGRNVLELEAAKCNSRAGAAVPAVDLTLGGDSILAASGGKKFGLIVAFPELLPQSALPKTDKESDQLSALWGAVSSLLADGGVFIVAYGSSDAERFDRRKPSGFSRLGNVRRKGFRASAYAGR